MEGILLISDNINAGEHLALEVFERCAAACGDMSHLVCKAQLDNSCSRVTAADNCGSIGLSAVLCSFPLICLFSIAIT